MRSIVGLTLLLTGLGLGAYAYYPETVQQHIDLANVTRVIAPIASAERPATSTSLHINNPRPRAMAAPAPAPAIRNFSPGTLLLAIAMPSNPGKAEETGSIGPPSLATNDPKATNRLAAIPRAPVGGWHTVVKPAIANKHGARGLKSSRPADGSARYALIRDMQRELKRVGCYWGKIDGSWGNGTKWAMSQFLKSVNATLPSKNPDYILLSLVHAQPGQVCGVEKDKSIVASIVPAPTRAAIPIKQRVGTLPAPPKPARETKTAALATEVLAVPKPRRALNSPRQSSYAKPLPGRMAIGGPIPDATDAVRTKSNERALSVTTPTQDKSKYRAHPNTQTARVYDQVTPNEPSSSLLTSPPNRTKAKINTPRAVKTKRAYKKARLAKKAKQKAKRRQYSRRRAKNPLSNLLRQGVY